MRATLFAVLFAALLIAAGYSINASRRGESPAPAVDRGWNPAAAAAYLDRRADWWMRWDGAARDHGTFCISCHTALPYALSRPSLSRLLEREAPPQEVRMLLDVTKRVRLGRETEPYYSDQNSGSYKTSESRGTEAVINALVLASRDARRGTFADDTRVAFDRMWATQETSGTAAGAWSWLQFGLKPWEAADSQYYGAALAALAVATAPAPYRAMPSIRANVALLRSYLARRYPKEALANRLVLLWASGTWPDLLDAERRRELEAEVLDAQRPDGGWCLSPLARSWRSSTVHSYVRSWIRRDYTLVDSRSDGYATGLATLALLKAGVSRDDARLQRARRWLAAHQNPADGSWPGYSLNEHREPTAEAGPFMSDAATAFATLALIEADAR